MNWVFWTLVHGYSIRVGSECRFEFWYHFKGLHLKIQIVNNLSCETFALITIKYFLPFQLFNCMSCIKRTVHPKQLEGE